MSTARSVLAPGWDAPNATPGPPPSTRGVEGSGMCAAGAPVPPYSGHEGRPAPGGRCAAGGGRVRRHARRRRGRGRARRAPTVVVAGDGTEFALQAWAWCWTDATSGGCADGAPPDHPASIGSPDAVEITFPHEGWWFRATLVESTTDDCPRHILTNLSRETAT